MAVPKVHGDNSRGWDAVLRHRAEWAAPLLIPVILLVALLLIAGLDPAPGMTASRSPFTDEAWSVIGARNLARFGTWATDDWHLYLVNLPFSGLEALSFQVLGVGIVQARLVSILATVGTTALLAIGLRRPFGRLPAAIGAASFAASTLVLFYGHLALLEPLVATGLTLAVVLVWSAGGERAGRSGLLAGLALALAIGTKPNAVFASIGILLGVAIVGGRHDRVVRRWLMGALASIAASAVAWVVVVLVPHGSEVAADIRIWPAQHLPGSVGDLVYSIVHYPFSTDGAIPAALVLGIAGMAGLVGSIARWSDLDAGRRRMVGAATGWLVVGVVPLFGLDYHPNWYVVPLLPAFSVLLGAGLSIARPTFGGSTLRRRVAAIGLVVVLVLPGLAAYGSWLTSGTSDLVPAQTAVARLLPAGSVVEGDLAPLLAMTSGATTIVRWPNAGVNAGDGYADQGVRYVVTSPNAPPSWVSRHRAAWAARQALRCMTWGGEVVCLFAVP